MADNERLVKALKDLPLRIQTSSLTLRRTVIEDVIDVLDHSGISEIIIKGICRAIQYTLPRYHDGISQYLVRNLITSLIRHHPKWSVRGLLTMLADVAAGFKTLVATPKISKVALTALRWSCLVVIDGWKSSEDVIRDEISNLVNSQCVLYTCIATAGNKRLTFKAYNKLHILWSSIPNLEILYMNTLIQSEQTYFVSVLSSTLIKHLSQADLKEFVDKNLDTFIKTLVSCKTKPLNTAIEACYPMLKRLNHEQFKSTLLPALQKAMLRNPEIIIECVGLILAGVTIDLSQYALDVSKGLITNLHSKDDVTRRESADACKLLAQQCSDSGAIESVVKQIFSVFHGSDGKLTVLEHKISVLEGAGNLSYNSVTGSNLQNLIAQVSNEFIKVLETEVHEKTLCYTLEMLSLWVSKINNDVPKKLIDALKNGMSLKTSTASVRISYIQCMLACFHSNTISQAEVLVGVLQKSVDRAISQPTLALGVTEGLCATYFLLKIMESQGDRESKLSSVCSILFDMDKQLFVSEKFLATASDDALIQVMQLCELLLLEYPEKFNGKAAPLYRAVLICMTSSSAVVRKKCLPAVQRIVSGLGGTTIAQALLRDFLKLIDSKNDPEQNAISPHVLIDCIQVLCSGSGTVEEATTIALEALLPCHIQAIFSVLPNLWITIMKRSKLNPKEFISQKLNPLKKMLVDDYVATPYYENALATVVKTNGREILRYLLRRLKEKLYNPNVRQITKDEYFTYLTPEGELYDKSVLPLPEDQKDEASNMKRESKAYSYKEQLEEMQLRRELEEKKRREGKIKVPQYSAKQLEVIKNQKIKEQGIREKLTELNTVITNYVSMIRAASNGNPIEFSLYSKDLLPLILQNMHSPLSAPHLTKLYVDLHEVFFKKDLSGLGDLVAHVTLRLIKPHCDLDESWEQEDLPKAASRAITLIYDHSMKKTDGKNPATPHHHFTAPAFTYSFQLIKLMLLSAQAPKDEGLIHISLQIISEHSKLRHNVKEGAINLYDPRYLPRQQMFELLIELISSTSGRIQSQAVTCLLDVAISASGAKNCSKASVQELEVLLTALQNPKDVVRDSALRGLAYMIQSIPTFDESYDLALKINKRVWIARFDSSEENKDLADKLWDDGKMSFPSMLSEELMADIEHPVECVQSSAAKALAALIKDDESQVQPIVETLLLLYKNTLKMAPAKVDEFGRELEKPIDNWGPRRGVGLALAGLAPFVDSATISKLIQFFVPTALSDRSEEVRKEMLTAALAIVDLHGKVPMDIEFVFTVTLCRLIRVLQDLSAFQNFLTPYHIILTQNYLSPSTVFFHGANLEKNNVDIDEDEDNDHFDDQTIINVDNQDTQGSHFEDNFSEDENDIELYLSSEDE
ncbi:eIF-2-alpha kinase activator GCN1-like [Photinus pyralis]|uniref:eIF-2-alpha kinase activator GCN1-like n=1 Tax=Photinus pyralis TaxID=7054 RepID=UPI001267392D|nr:eIF-2-alpha kinase activator GCN1-like [Photinus pyralis]